MIVCLFTYSNVFFISLTSELHCFLDETSCADGMAGAESLFGDFSEETFSFADEQQVQFINF